ncbi:Calx-beta domain protein [Gimesia panareensis]|nr:Calx-beta domain protein [Gimesia panareensis]
MCLTYWLSSLKSWKPKGGVRRRMKRRRRLRKGYSYTTSADVQIVNSVEDLEDRLLLTGLVINIDGTAAADDFRVQTTGNGGNLEVFNAAELVFTSSVEFVSAINIHGAGGFDTLTLDFSNGLPFPLDQIHFDGQAEGGQLILEQGSSQDSLNSIAYTFEDHTTGSIALDGHLLNFTNTEVVVDSLETAEREFHFTGASQSVTLADAGSNDDGVMSLSTPAGTSVTFSDPADLLKIVTENADSSDEINVEAIDQLFSEDLDLFGDENDSVNFSAPELNLADHDLTVTGQTIKVATQIKSSSGDLTFSAGQNIVLREGSGLTTSDGEILLQANLNGTATGDFSGIAAYQAALTTTGSGNITLFGVGGNETAAQNYLADGHNGVALYSGTTITSTAAGPDAGMISITGEGGQGRFANRGIMFSDVVLSSASGNITLLGQGGGSAAGAYNDGIAITDSRIVSTGTGSDAALIELTGAGGMGTDYNAGVVLQGTSDLAHVAEISSVDGNISISGQGGGNGTGSGNLGILQKGFAIRSLGTGEFAATITLVGIGAEGEKYNQGVVLYPMPDASQLPSITTIDGDVLITGTGGDQTNLGVNMNQAIVSSTGTGEYAAQITIDSYGSYLFREHARTESAFGDVNFFINPAENHNSADFMMQKGATIYAGWGNINLDVFHDIYLTQLVSAGIVTVDAVTGSIIDNDDYNPEIYALVVQLSALLTAGTSENPLELSVRQQLGTGTFFTRNTNYRKMIHQGEGGFQTGTQGGDRHFNAWEFSDLLPGVYRISGHWPAGAGQAAQLDYTFSASGYPDSSGTIEQQQLNTAPNAGEPDWYSLGFVHVDQGGHVTVRLADSQANRPVPVDSVQIEQLDSLLSISDVIVDEDAGTVSFQVTSSHAAGSPFTVDYETVDGTALAGSDYEAVSGTLNFTGDSDHETQTIVVPLLNDTDVELAEWFSVKLSHLKSAANLALEQTQARAMITSEDPLLKSVSADETLLFDPQQDLSLSGSALPLTIIDFDSASTAGAEITLVEGKLTYDPTAVSTLQAFTAAEQLTDTFTFTVRDAQGSTTQLTALVTVQGVDDPPVLTTPLQVDIPENQTLVIDLNALDPEGETENGGGLSFSITGGADQGAFEIDADTGELHFKTAPDYDHPQDANRDNRYQVDVAVRDSAGNTTVSQLEVHVTDVVDFWAYDQTYSESGYIVATGAGKNFHITVENMPAGSLARIIGAGARGANNYTQKSEDFALPESGQISFELDRIPGWGPKLVIIVPSGPSYGEGTGISFGEEISDTGSLIGVNGGGTAYFGGQAGNLQITADHDPVWTEHVSQLQGLGLIDALKQAENQFVVTGNRKIPTFEFVVEQQQLQINTENFVEGFELVIEADGVQQSVTPVQVTGLTSLDLPTLTGDLDIYLRDMETQIQVGPAYHIPVTDGAADHVLHRKVQLITLGYYEALYDQIMHAADVSALHSALESLQSSGNADPKLVGYLQSSFDILNGEITLYREETRFLAPIPWNLNYYSVAIDQESFPEDAVSFAEVDSSGVLKIKLRDDFQGDSFQITFLISNGNHTRSVTTTFHLVTGYLVSLRNTIDQFTTLAADLQTQLDDLQNNYALADSMDAQADAVLKTYLQQIQDPSQIVTPELHVIANRFQYQFVVEFRDFPDEGYSVQYAGGDLYPLTGRDGSVTIDSLPRPDINLSYPLELIDPDGEVVELLTNVSVIAGKISRAGGIDATYPIAFLAHVPPVPEELQVTLEEKEAAEQQKIDAANLRTDTDSQIATLTTLREQVLADIAENQQVLADYLARYQIPRDGKGAYFEYLPEGTEYAIEVRAWDTEDHTANLVAYDAFDKNDQTAFKVEATVASIDLINLPQAATQFAVDLDLRTGQSVTVHFYRGGEQIAEQVVSESSSVVFEHTKGISAVIFTTELGSVYDLSHISFSGAADWDFDTDVLSTQENQLIAREVAPESWGTISSVLVSTVFNWYLAEFNILQYYANGMDGASQNQYFLLGATEGKFDEYTLFTPESTQGSPSLGSDPRYGNGVLYLNDDGWHILPQKYYTFTSGALVMHPGSPRAIAVRVDQGSDVVVNYRESGSDYDTLFDSLTNFDPDISIQVLRQGSYPDPGFHAGIKEIQDGETPVIFNGEPFYVISTIWNTSAYSGPLVIDVYAGPESVPRAAYIGRFETSIGGFENKTLIVNATSPDVGEGRPSITFVRINEDGSEDVVAGKHGRKAGRKTKAEREAINEQKKKEHGEIILNLVAEQHGIDSAQYASTYYHLEETLGVSLPNPPQQGEDDPETVEDPPPIPPAEKQLIALALDIDVSEVDNLDATDPQLELIQKIQQLVRESQDPRFRALREIRESGDEPTENFLIGVFKPEELEQLKEDALAALSETVEESTEFTTQVLSDQSVVVDGVVIDGDASLSRWWATAGGAPIDTTWTVEVTKTGVYKFSVIGFDLWKFGDAELYVDGVKFVSGSDFKFELNQGIALPEMLSIGVHKFEFKGVKLPYKPVIEALKFRLTKVDGIAPLSEQNFEARFIADHSEEFNEASGFRIYGQDGVETIVGVSSLVNTFAPVLEFNQGEDFPMPVSAETYFVESGLDNFGKANDSFPINQSFSSSGKIYATVLRNPDDFTSLAITYHFFYPRSNWGEESGYNTHEGDWESATVFLQMNGDMVWEPERVALAQHLGGVKVHWENLFSINNHVYLFIGLGGHATYGSSDETVYPTGLEEHYGDGVIFDSQNKVEYLSRVGTETSQDEWFLYTGQWGSHDLGGFDEFFNLAGDNAPRGPITNSLWFDPWGWSTNFNWDLTDKHYA